MAKIRVLHLIDHLGLGGVQNLLAGLSKHMDRGLFETEIAVLYGHRSFNEKEFTSQGVPVHYLSRSPYSSASQLFALSRLLGSKSFDILHTHLFFGCLFGLAAALPRPALLKIVSIEHMPEQVPFFCFPVYRACGPAADAFFAVNGPIEKDALAAGLPRKKLHALTLGCDADAFSGVHDRMRLRKTLGIPEKDPVIFRSARLAPDKRHDLFLKAMPPLLRRVPSAKLMIAGDGPSRARLEKLAAELGVENSVYFLGNRKNLPELNAVSDLGAELGFGIATLEHMAAGLPVVSFDAVGARDLIRDGENGAVSGAEDVEGFAEKAAYFLLNEAERARAGKNARETVMKRYSHQVMAREYAALYGRLLEEKRRQLSVFDFGANWKDFSEKKLDAAKLAAAEASLKTLLGSEDLRGLSFLDVGCGSGIFSIAAQRLGVSRALGVDVNETAVEVSRKNAVAAGADGVEFSRVDVLHREAMRRLGRFDVVYAWGSLHHTGDLWQAVQNVCGAVSPGGRLVLAVYNRHFTSGAWKFIKKIYNRASPPFQRAMTVFFCPVIFVSKALLTLKNPLKLRRGMDFYTDVVDWVGGYPYEYASPAEVTSFVEKNGFRRQRIFPSWAPTGNNEFVFVKERE